MKRPPLLVPKITPTLSIVIPAHNASKYLKSTIDLILRQLEPVGITYEILVMENGSTDATCQVAEELAREHPQVRVLSDATHPGKGRAVANGILQSHGTYACFCDADLEISPEHIIPLLQALKEGNQIATVSKRHPDSVVTSPLRRSFLSIGYNSLVRLIFRTGLYSHQDGLKAFRKEDILRLLPYAQDTGWFWDTEVLVLAKMAGYHIKELPIHCDYGWESTFDPLSGVGYFLPRLVSLLFRYPSLRRKVRASRVPSQNLGRAAL